MRLSELLNKAPDTAALQVEGFLGSKKIPWGQSKKVEIGKVIRNYYCRKCTDMRTFMSGETLYCLVTGPSSVSLDVTLRCTACESPMEAWFLVGCIDDLYSYTPTVQLERFTENRRDVAGGAGAASSQIDDFLERAQIAYDDHLGAGSIIYLRKVFELITSQVADVAGISKTTANNRRKSFKDLLKEVDESKRIVPAEFSSNGYKLFGELSEIIHGDADEDEALKKFVPCRQLVLGVVLNVRNNEGIAAAIAALGWEDSHELRIVSEASVA